MQPETGYARSQSRGGKGRRDISTGGRNGLSVAAVGLSGGAEIMVISRSGQLVRMAGDTIREVGRGSKGVRVVSLKGNDDVIAVAPIAESDDGDASEGGADGVES